MNVKQWMKDAQSKKVKQRIKLEQGIKAKMWIMWTEQWIEQWMNIEKWMKLEQ